MEDLAEKGILTLAIGKKFNKQAKHLAYSCILNSPSLPRAIITDNTKYFHGLYDIVIQYTEDMGDPFNVKLNLQHYSPFFETLFLDSDTLVYTDLHFAWNYFNEQSIVYVGSCQKEGKWYFKEIADVLKYFDIPWIGRLNSGVFLFRKDETGMNILNYAAELHGNHGDIHVPFFRGKWLPDEPFLAIAFGKYGQFPKNDFGRFGYSLLRSKKIKLDIIKGISIFVKDDKTVFPAVVHFTAREHIYTREKLKLFLYYKGIPCISLISYPVYIIAFCKSLIRWIKRYLSKKI